jgi:pimeloyl-[acyl-carrier protein] methyl ester esterase
MLARASEIHCPVRLLHGGRDRICPLDAARLFAEALPRAELTVWPEAGHAPFLSQPDRFRSWLQS